jgi:cyclopropane fatty-acyl-phospholipid synthase-like methyltransferase
MKDTDSLENELWDYKDRLREGLLKYTREAFRMLPVMRGPKVLDVGCGSGVVTMELAKLTGGEVTGIDIDQAQLNRLVAKVDRSGLSGRAKAVNRSMLDLNFAEGSFDIIWAEGSIAVMGFARGIKEWRTFLKDGGYLVIHDDLGGIEEKMEQIPRCGYELMGHFILNEDIWWQEYYAPLADKLNEMRSRYARDKRITELLSQDQREVDGFSKDRQRYRSVFYILKKL